MVGTISSFIYTSTEFCKIQIQMKTPGYTHYTGATDIFWSKLKEGKIHHIFRGGMSTLVREGVGALLYFTVYENYIRSKLKKGEISHSVSRTQDILAAGSLAGISYWLLIYPVDAIKTQIQSSMCKTYVESARFLWQNKLLFRGITVAIVRSVPVNAVNFLVFERVIR
jgi:solute carrier family 25 carnitine/acylcarnitine transporter 20/29